MAATGGANGLPSYWKVSGPKASPFFQNSPADESRSSPRELFVGRMAETKQLLAGIRGASTSGQTLGGAPGAGKTTLVQRVKAATVTPSSALLPEGPSPIRALLDLATQAGARGVVLHL